MSNIIEEQAGWPDVPLLSTRDLVLGGEGGPSNAQAKALEARTKYLKGEVEKFTDFAGSPLVPDAEWTDVPAHSDPAFDVQAQALVNRAEYISKELTNPSGDEPLGGFDSYAKVRSYSGNATRLKVQDPTGYHWWVRDDSVTESDDGTRLIDGKGRGWRRERVDKGKHYPEWFYKTTDGGDWVPAISRAIESMSKVGGGRLLFTGGSYAVSSYSSKEYGHGAIFDIVSNITFEWNDTSEIFLSNFFDNKRFVLFSGLNAVNPSDFSRIENTHFKNIRVTSDIGNNYMRDVYTRRIVLDFGKCFNCSVNGGYIHHIDLANAIGTGFGGEGAFCEVDGVLFEELTSDASFNFDHTTCYMGTMFSDVRNCKFIGYCDNMWKVACPVELHGSNSHFHDSDIVGYTRAVWFTAHASEYANVSKCSAYNLTATVTNAAVYLWADAGAILENISVYDNDFECYHKEGFTQLYAGYQGLFQSSGAGGGVVRNIEFKGNNTVITRSRTPLMATAWSVEFNYLGVEVLNNTFKGAYNGVKAQATPFASMDRWVICGNRFDCTSAPVGVSEDTYLSFKATTYTNNQINGNTFIFDAGRAPDCTLSWLGGGSFFGNYVGGFLHNRATPGASDFNTPDGYVAGGSKLNVSIYGIMVELPEIEGKGKSLIDKGVSYDFAYGNRCEVAGAYPLELVISARTLPEKSLRFYAENYSTSVISERSIGPLSVNVAA